MRDQGPVFYMKVKHFLEHCENPEITLKIGLYQILSQYKIDLIVFKYMLNRESAFELCMRKYIDDYPIMIVNPVETIASVLFDRPPDLNPEQWGYMFITFKRYQAIIDDPYLLGALL